MSRIARREGNLATTLAGDLVLREATAEDRAAVEQLLRSHHLPIDGIGAALEGFVIAQSTTTAERWFPAFGFVVTPRREVPDALRSSVEFQGACPASAILMVRPIARRVAAKVR